MIRKNILLMEFRPGSCCSKLMTLLVKKTLNFKRYCMQKFWHFLLKKCEELLQQLFSQKYYCINFVSTGRLNESSLNNFVKLIML